MSDLLIALLYGAIALVTLGLAIASRREMLIRLGAIMFCAWVLCNAATLWVGFPRAPLLIPTIDAGLALSVPLIAGRSGVASVVFGIFVAIGIVNLDAFLVNVQGTPSYYLTLNMLFLAQVAAVGGASGLACLADRARSRSLFAGLHLGDARVDAEERKSGA